MSTKLSNHLPLAITSYDLIKGLAVILMIIDHIGVHFYPEEVWFRIIGRLCVPIWFFLIGYARTTEIPRLLWLGAIAVLASSFLAGQYLLPLNILFTIMVARMIRQGLVERALHNPETLRGMFLILAFASIPSTLVLEYGTIGFLFVVMGYACRNWAEVTARIAPKYILLFVAGAMAVFWMMQGGLREDVSSVQSLALALGLGFIAALLLCFRSVQYPLTAKMLRPFIVGILRFIGRYTLEIYIFHIIIFRMIAIWLYPEIFPAFELKIFAGGAGHIFF